MKNKAYITLILAAAIGSGASFAQASDYAGMDCATFREGVMSGKIPPTDANRQRAAVCNQPSGPSPQTTKDLDRVEVRGTQPTKPDMGKAAGVAGKGCGIGAVVGSLVGVDGSVGCAIGGAIGFGWSYKKQLKEARELGNAANDAGMVSEVKTEQVQNSRGKSEERLALIAISYDPADMQRMDPKTTATMDKIAAYAEKSKTALVFRFEGGAACSIPRDNLMSRGVLDRHTVEDRCQEGGEHKLSIIPGAE